MKEKVILAYSGGLDTTTIIPWLKENFGYEVVCCCIDCGQGSELDGLDERAKLSGASKLYIEDLVDDFCDNYIVPCVMANAVYENKYLLGTSMARPAIAKCLVDIARFKDHRSLAYDRRVDLKVPGRRDRILQAARHRPALLHGQQLQPRPQLMAHQP